MVFGRPGERSICASNSAIRASNCSRVIRRLAPTPAEMMAASVGLETDSGAESFAAPLDDLAGGGIPYLTLYLMRKVTR